MWLLIDILIFIWLVCLYRRSSLSREREGYAFLIGMQTGIWIAIFIQIYYIISYL